MQQLTINNNVYEPKFNFAFYKQVSKGMATDSQDGFTVLIQQLVTDNASAIIDAYYYGMAWYKHNQPTMDQIEEALEDTVFASDEATEKGTEEILKDLASNNFLARTISSYIKDTESSLDIMQARLEKEPENSEQRQNLELGLKISQDQLNKLRTLTGCGLTQSPTDDKSESVQVN